MRKRQFLAVFYTMLLAIPLTALALMFSAYLTDHLVEITTSIVTFSQATSVGHRGWALEFAARWPELAGMIVGQAVILIILLLVRHEQKTSNENSNGQSK
jgi:hypothetical protein